MEEMGGGLGRQRGQVRGIAALPGKEKAHQIGAVPLGQGGSKAVDVHRLNPVLPFEDGLYFEGGVWI